MELEQKRRELAEKEQYRVNVKKTMEVNAEQTKQKIISNREQKQAA